MKKLNKKGFTIVELVIVIAVIAILAAVLIPTFSGVVSRANQSAALQTARSTLTNVLNMSSTAQLQGKDTNGYHTYILVDGQYAYGYNGNQIEAIDKYPTNTPSSTTYDMENKVWAKGINTIIIAMDNLIEDTYAQNTYITVGESSEADLDSYYVKDGDNFNNATSPYDSDTEYYIIEHKAGEGKGTFKLDATVSSYIAYATDFEAGSGDSYQYTVTLENGNYTVTDGTKTCALLLNTDLSKKVVVLTTFTQA